MSVGAAIRLNIAKRMIRELVVALEDRGLFMDAEPFSADETALIQAARKFAESKMKKARKKK